MSSSAMGSIRSSGDSISRTRIVSSSACSLNPAPNLSPRSPLSPPTFRHARTPTFRPNFNSISRSITLYPDSATFLRETTCARARTPRIEWQEAVHMAQSFEAPHAAEFTPPVLAACAGSTICAKPVNFAHIASPIADCAIAAQSAPGNSGNAQSRGRSRKTRASHEYAQPTNFSSALLGTARAATKARWSFDLRNGATLRAPLELDIPKSELYFSPYTGYAWSQPPQ